MQTDRLKCAAQMLYEARKHHRQIDRLPEDCAPRTPAEGYAVQSELVRLIGDPIVGWKVGCTTAEAQQRAGTTEPFSGPVLRRDLYQSGCEVPANAYFTCALQVEFAFRLSRDLPMRAAPFTTKALREAVGTVLPALEIADSRFVDSTVINAPSLIADGGKAGALIVGPTETDLLNIDIVDHVVVLRVNGRPVARGCGRNVMGDPLNSLCWLANAMASRGESLLAGQLISTGTCTGSHIAEQGDNIVADYGSLGTIEIRLVGSA